MIVILSCLIITLVIFCLNVFLYFFMHIIYVHKFLNTYEQIFFSLISIFIHLPLYFLTPEFLLLFSHELISYYSCFFCFYLLEQKIRSVSLHTRDTSYACSFRNMQILYFCLLSTYWNTHYGWVYERIVNNI